MNKKLRESKILELLSSEGSIEVKDIVLKFDISENTARRDLQNLEEQGLLIRTHGGAMQTSQQFSFINFDSRLNKDKYEKEQLCKTAVSMIEENDVIFIDGGTTLFFMHKYLKERKNVIVITHSIPLIYHLMYCSGIKLILIGGELDSTRQLSLGHIAAKNIEEYHANKAFICTDGLSIKNGITFYESREALLTKNIIRCSDKIILVCSSDKLEKDTFIKVESIDKIDHLITDEGLNLNLRDEYSQHLNLHVVKTKQEI